MTLGVIVVTRPTRVEGSFATTCRKTFDAPNWHPGDPEVTIWEL